jgi:hypothetical protein
MHESHIQVSHNTRHNFIRILALDLGKFNSKASRFLILV